MSLRLLRFYRSRGLRVEKAFMQYVWGVNGKRYVDCHTGHGVAFLGHNNPNIVEALKTMLSTLMVCSISFECRVQEEAIEKLSRIAPRHLDTVLFSNSGAEAVEAALKMAWAYTGRRRLVAFRGGFHGRTLGALSVTWNPRYRQNFPVLENVVFIPYNADPTTLEKLFPKDAAAVIVEPILGEGGVVPAREDFMRAVEEQAQRTGALLIADEVQTGVGRTGRVWGYEHYRVKPDILVAGKALGGGFPVAAVLANWEIAESLTSGRHGSTYAGNPLALAAVAAAAEHAWKARVHVRAWEAGQKLLKAIEDATAGNGRVRSIRGLGLMVGVEVRGEPTSILKCMQDHGVLALKAGLNVVRLLPPYMINESDVEVVASAISSCIQ